MTARSGRSQRWLAPAVVGAVYAAAAWAVLLPFGLLGSARLPVSASQDVGQQVWWLALVLHELTHGSWSFFTAAIDHPAGVNLLDNGSMPLLGLLMAPATAAFGPIAAYLLLLRIGHLLSACSACWVARRLGFGRSAAAVTGLVYGFGPAMGPPTAQHAFLVFAPLPPLMLYVVYRTLRGPREPGRELGAHALRAGLLLGVLVAAQYLISAEVLVSTLLVAVATVALVALWSVVRRHSWTFSASWRLSLSAAGRLVAGAAASAVPLLAYPVGYMLLGRAHVDGPVQATGQPGVDLLSVLLPARTTGNQYGEQLLAALWHGWSLGRGLWPIVNVGYLGPLALIAAVVAVLCRSDPRVRIATLFGVIALVLALGPRLSVAGHVLALRLPFALLYRTPVLQDAEPTRLTLLVDLAVGLLLAAGVDRCLRLVYSRSGHRSSVRWRGPGAAAGLAVIAGALALAAPATGLTGYPVATTRSVAKQIGRRIPAGAVVLALPYPSFNHEPAMLLQAQAGVGFELLGGYAIRPYGRLRHATKTTLLSAPPAIAALLERRRLGPVQTRAAATELPRWLRSEHVTAVLELRADANSRALSAVLRHRLGTPRAIGRWLLWSLASRRLSR